MGVDKKSNVQIIRFIKGLFLSYGAITWRCLSPDRSWWTILLKIRRQLEEFEGRGGGTAKSWVLWVWMASRGRYRRAEMDFTGNWTFGCLHIAACYFTTLKYVSGSLSKRDNEISNGNGSFHSNFFVYCFTANSQKYVHKREFY
jgi:hypothetical protein